MAATDNEELAKSLGLSWSDTEFELSEFLDSFTLPQVVQVSEGVYGVSEESTLPAGQTLTLHVVKATKMYRGYTYEGEDVLLPLNCPQTVEVRPQNVSLLYDTVEELCTVFPRHVKYVRVTKDHVHPTRPERCLKAGQKLTLDYISKQNSGSQVLMCLDEGGCEVCLSMDVQGGFQPLMDSREYFLAELTKHFCLPIYVQFTSPPKFNISEDSAAKDSKLLSGVIQVDEMVVENTVIASTREGRRKTILTFPRTLDVTLIVPKQLLVKDSNYARVCESLNDGVDLVRVQSVVVPENEIIYSSRAQIVREYSYTVEQFGDSTPREDVNKDYNVMTPQENQTDLTVDVFYEDVDGDDHNYECIDDDDEYQVIDDEFFESSGILKDRKDASSGKDRTVTKSRSGMSLFQKFTKKTKKQLPKPG